MKLEWLREYRDFTEKLIKFANAYAGMYKQEKYYAKDIAFNSIQLQVMEYLLENEERNDKMAQIAQRLAITPSTFSKTVAKLEGKGMVEKPHLRQPERCDRQSDRLRAQGLSGIRRLRE